MVSFTKLAVSLALLTTIHQAQAGQPAPVPAGGQPDPNPAPGKVVPPGTPTDGTPNGGTPGTPTGGNGGCTDGANGANGANGAGCTNGGTTPGTPNGGTPTTNGGCGANGAGGAGCGNGGTTTTTGGNNGGTPTGGNNGGTTTTTGGNNGGGNNGGGNNGGNNGGGNNGGGGGQPPVVITTGRPGTGQALGDPHLRTLDGKHFDFMKPGMFTLVDSPNGLKIHAAMAPCQGMATCTTAVGIGYHGTVVRFVRQGNQIAVARGSDLGALTVKSGNNRRSYRVFVNNDPSSYVDINLNQFFDTSATLSSYFKDGASGVLATSGNENQLAAQFAINGANLLSCTDCSGLVGAFSTVPQQTVNQWADQGFRQMSANDIPLQPVSNRRALRSAGTNDTTTNAPPLDEAKVKEMCTQVIDSIPHCAQFIELREFYLDSVCVKDTLLGRDMQHVDDAKLAYLRQCRRKIDIELHHNANANNTNTDTDTDAITQKRAALNFGTEDECPNRCNGRGECLLSGCKCNQGFSGTGCSITL